MVGDICFSTACLLACMRASRQRRLRKTARYDFIFFQFFLKFFILICLIRNALQLRPTFVGTVTEIAGEFNLPDNYPGDSIGSINSFAFTFYALFVKSRLEHFFPKATWIILNAKHGLLWGVMKFIYRDLVNCLISIDNYIYFLIF